MPLEEPLDRLTQFSKEGKTEHDFTTIVVLMVTPQADAVRKMETKNWNGLKMKGAPKRKSPVRKTITESDDQAMDQNNGLEAKFFREGTRTTLTMDLWEIPHSLPEFLSQARLRIREQQSKHWKIIWSTPKSIIQ